MLPIRPCQFPPLAPKFRRVLEHADAALAREDRATAALLIGLVYEAMKDCEINSDLSSRH